MKSMSDSIRMITKVSINAALFLAALSSGTALYAQTDTTKADTMKVDTTAPPPPPPAAAENPAETEEPESDFQTQRYVGGTLGATFGDYTSIRVQPMIGWMFSPKLSGGLKVGYEYVSDNRYDPSLTSHNYGASAFGRYHLIPQVYGHAEFAYISYEYYTSLTNTTREWIPFLFAGAGYIQQLSPSTGVYVEVLFDVLQDSRSPYDEWEPFVSIGVQVGM